MPGAHQNPVPLKSPYGAPLNHLIQNVSVSLEKRYDHMINGCVKGFVAWVKLLHNLHCFWPKMLNCCIFWTFRYIFRKLVFKKHFLVIYAVWLKAGKAQSHQLKSPCAPITSSCPP